MIPSPELLRRRAAMLAAALDMNDFATIEGMCTHHVTLWSTLRDRFGQHGGRAGVRAALQRILAPVLPDRIRILRNEEGSAILSGSAGDVYLWTLEVIFDDGLIDAIMVWLPPTSPVMRALLPDS